MKSEPIKQKKNNVWIIDESKFLCKNEVNKLKKVSNSQKIQGLRENRFAPVRNWFMLELGLNSGLRVSEMASLTHGCLIINESKSSIVVFGKGSKKRAVWINSKFRNSCREYINYKIKFGYSVDSDSYLLNNFNGDKISKRALQKFFSDLVKNSGLPAHYHIHCLRHTYATFLLKASNNNYRFVQSQLGHASIRTTQIYAGVIESEGKKAIEKLYD